MYTFVMDSKKKKKKLNFNFNFIQLFEYVMFNKLSIYNTNKFKFKIVNTT